VGTSIGEAAGWGDLAETLPLSEPF